MTHRAGVVMGYDMRDAEVAAETFAALCALDGCGIARAELLAAGVASGTVENLYPTDYTTVLAGFIKYLRQWPESALYAESRTWLLEQKEADFKILLATFGPELYVRWHEAAHAGKNSADAAVLKAHITALKGNEGTGGSRHASIYTSSLWNMWWLMKNRGLLTEPQQAEADSLFNSTSWSLYPYLIPDVGAAEKAQVRA